MGAKDQGADATAGRWIIIPRTLCFITHGDDVLLIKRAAHKRVFPGRYNGIGGHVERDEDVLTATLREIQEETGLDVTAIRFRGIIHVDAGFPTSGIMVFVFTAQARDRAVIATQEGTLEWVPLARATELPLVEDLPILLELLFGSQPDGPPFFAHSSYDADDKLRMIFAVPPDVEAGAGGAAE